jgi:hypothetical protein
MSVPIPEKKDILFREYNERAKFIKTYEIDGIIFFIPFTYPGIIVYNTMNKSIIMIDSWINEINELIFDNELSYFFEVEFDKIRNCLVLPCLIANAILELNPDTFSFNIRKLSNEKTGFLDIKIIDSTYWLLNSHKTAITRFDSVSGEFEEYIVTFDEVYSEEYYQYQRIEHIGDELYLIPSQAEHMLRFNLNEKKFVFVDEFLSQKPSKNESDWHHPHNFLFTSEGYIDGKIYLHAGKTSNFIEFDPLTGKMREEKIDITSAVNFDKLGDNIYEDKLLNLEIDEFNSSIQCALTENWYFNLKNMLNILVKPKPLDKFSKMLEKQTELRLGVIANSDGKAGQVIYDYCKKAVTDL